MFVLSVAMLCCFRPFERIEVVVCVLFNMVYVVFVAVCFVVL